MGPWAEASAPCLLVLPHGTWYPRWASIPLPKQPLEEAEPSEATELVILLIAHSQLWVSGPNSRAMHPPSTTGSGEV